MTDNAAKDNGPYGYRAVVVDPPWEMPNGGGYTTRGGHPRWRRNMDTKRVGDLPYASLTLDHIKALPVASLAADHAHLYLWAPNYYLEHAYDVARAWDFQPSTMLVWAKTPRGLGLGGAFTVTTEYVLFCRRGTLKARTRLDTTWWNFKRPHNAHSAKPDGFLDVVEQVSPGPYVELFARRARFGWDYYGDESLGTAELSDDR